MPIDLVVPENVELENLLRYVRILCWKASDVLKAYARGGDPPYGFSKYLTVKDEGDGPVSAADMAVNQLLLSGLKEKFPLVEWDILSEESVKEKQLKTGKDKKAWQWILDPLDGTKDFLQGSENYAVHLALSHKKKPRIGIVLIPELDEIWFGVIGKGAWCENRTGVKKPVCFSSRSDISKLILVSSKNHKNKSLQNLIKFIAFGKTKKMGSVGCKVASILRGESDVYISLSGETAPKDWDMAAPQAVIEAAGGSFTHANGRCLSYEKSDYSQRGCLIASHGKSHENICRKAQTFLFEKEPIFSI